MAADVKRMQADFGGDKAVQGANEVKESAKAVETGVNDALSAHKKFQIYWGVGTGVDVADKSIDIGTSFFDYDGYGDLKDAPTIEVGSQW
ncbi:hypothetical protein [Streptomyces sioyaensis]|uniref:hypothetical protein n=1 Tax=Streptomyces sioyaensis TaxID=67364 RepID=UPI003796A707